MQHIGLFIHSLETHNTVFKIYGFIQSIKHILIKLITRRKTCQRKNISINLHFRELSTRRIIYATNCPCDELSVRRIVRAPENIWCFDLKMIDSNDYITEPSQIKKSKRLIAVRYFSIYLFQFYSSICCMATFRYRRSIKQNSKKNNFVLHEMDMRDFYSNKSMFIELIKTISPSYTIIGREFSDKNTPTCVVKNYQNYVKS